MRELSVQAANDTNVSADRTAIKAELDQLVEEVDRIANNTQFNKQDILSADSTVTFQVGANNGQTITMNLKAMGKTALTINALDVSTNANANNAITTLDAAIEAVSSHRSNLGAMQNRLEHTVSNLNNAAENLTSAESRIRDVDMAEEMMKYSTSNILQQAAQSMLSQANQQPSQVLSLLR